MLVLNGSIEDSKALGTSPRATLNNKRAAHLLQERIKHLSSALHETQQQISRSGQNRPPSPHFSYQYDASASSEDQVAPSNSPKLDHASDATLTPQRHPDPARGNSLLCDLAPASSNSLPLDSHAPVPGPTDSCHSQRTIDGVSVSDKAVNELFGMYGLRLRS